MKKFILFSIILSVCLSARAQNYDNEFYSYYQDAQLDTCSSLKVKRVINGGTKILVSFNGNWDEDMKGAFRYACKIWEENLPTMLPITIEANIGSIRGNNANALSKVITYRLQNEEFGLAPQAKYILYQDYLHHVHNHYLSIQDSLVLSNNPDIKITYNTDFFNTNTFSFSLDTCSISKVDFVTQALRDIAAGLGFCTHFTPAGNKLELSDEMRYSGLEYAVKQAITTNNWYDAYNQATQGSLPLNITSYGTLYLYAPSTWQQGLSLNTFYPQNNSGISQLLTWKFGKGTIIRNIADDYDKLFQNCFNWNSELPDGLGNSCNFMSCNNDNAVNYQGTISVAGTSGFRYSSHLVEKKAVEMAESRPLKSRYYDDGYDFYNYCKPYDPTLSMNGTIGAEAWTFSILKKDGTWDVVDEFILPYEPYEIDLSEITLHYPDTAYARTADNYLRGRITNNKYDRCSSYYYVLEYLPQKIEQNLAKVYDDSYLQDEYSRDVEIAMSNLEGATHIYVEQLEEGDFLPSITMLPNTKSGRFLATVDKEYSSQFTIVSYNNNGSKRSNVLTVEPLEPANLNINVNNNRISVTYGHKNKQIENCTYSVNHVSHSLLKSSKGLSGKCVNGEIPSNVLKDGINIVKVVHPNGKSASVKIIKNKASASNKANLDLVL